MLILREEKNYLRAAQIIFALCAVAIFLTFRHYGISWDEEIQNRYGQAIFDYYVSGFADHHYNQVFNLYLYGGMFDGLVALLNAPRSGDIYAMRHLLNALFGLLGLWGAWRLGKLIGGSQVGLATLILLVLTPMYYGHMFNNPKDIPFAAGVVWNLYYMTKTLRSFPKVPWKTIVALGVVLGLTLGIRIGGVMLLGYWGIVLGMQAILMNSNAESNNRKGQARFLQALMDLSRLVLPVCAIAYAVMLLCWPWAQEAPLANPIRAFLQFCDFPQHVEVLLNGVTYMSNKLPWYYVPLYFVAQLPLPHLFLMGGGLFLLPLIMRDRPSRANRFALLLVLLTMFVPLVFATARHPVLYDAVRHFIFMLPLLCLLAALAFQQILKLARNFFLRVKTQRVRRLVSAGFDALIIVIVFAHSVTMFRLHPYEYIYVNPIEGGVKGAFGQYELDYWGGSFKEVAEKLQDYVAGEGGVPTGKTYRVAICGPWSSAMAYLPSTFKPVVANQPAEFFLSTTRWMCQGMRPGKEIIRVERMGVPLSIIKDLRKMPDYRAETHSTR